MSLIRIQKYLSEQGLASRREAEKLIAEGFVTLNGKVVREMGVKIDPAKDRVAIRTSTKDALANKKTTVLFHKPRGIVSSKVTSEGKTVFDLLPQFKSLNIIGRLDKDSEGLIVLSDDGVLARKITGPEHSTEKEYEITTREEIHSGLIKKLESGIRLSDGVTLPVKTKVLDRHTFRLVMREGRNHQIRRMCDYLHLTVTRLRRVRIGDFKLGGIQIGSYKII
jgi:pseudouridine synthase